jgi:hypothetical protein
MRLAPILTTLKSRRFWVWQIGGAIIYAIPAAIRLATGSVVLPILSLLEIPWIGHFIPGNLAEKVIVNAFFPGGAGAVAGEIYLQNRNSQAKRRRRYLSRLGGALLETSLFTLFQLWGNLQNIMGSYGGNIFEYPMVYPLNFILASLSIFTPDVFGFVKKKLLNTYHKLRG